MNITPIDYFVYAVFICFLAMALIYFIMMLCTICSGACDIHQSKRDKKLFTKENIQKYEADLKSFIRKYDIMHFLDHNTVYNLCKMLDINIEYVNSSNSVMVGINDYYTMYISENKSAYKKYETIAYNLAKIIRGVDCLEEYTGETHPHEHRIRKYYAASLMLPFHLLEAELIKTDYFSTPKDHQWDIMWDIADKYHVRPQLVMRRIHEYLTLTGE